MLTDIPNLNLRAATMDPTMSLILSVISDGETNRSPKHIGTGMYQLGHWNFDEMIRDVLIDSWPDAHVDEPEWDSIGVCDRPEQVIERYPFLVTSPRHFVISFVEIRKDAQPRRGGWRWHKWGSYIGDQQPQCEYLYDEPTIEVAWTFHIYEVKVP